MSEQREITTEEKLEKALKLLNWAAMVLNWFRDNNDPWGGSDDACLCDIEKFLDENPQAEKPRPMRPTPEQMLNDKQVFI